MGGGRAREETGGFYVEPTIFAGARNDMRIAQEEIFGPVVTAIPFGSEADGVRIANDTVYGLAAIVYTESLSLARRLSLAIEAGNVAVNNVDAGVINAPYGGWKASGVGVAVGSGVVVGAGVSVGTGVGHAVGVGLTVGGTHGSATSPCTGLGVPNASSDAAWSPRRA